MVNTWKPYATSELSPGAMNGSHECKHYSSILLCAGTSDHTRLLNENRLSNTRPMNYRLVRWMALTSASITLPYYSVPEHQTILDY
ncbi:hypothetical protein J6590_018861 [Homalodisca vitripennis]|nr:hypothetical protein J6590_018861 [Homalodisca vitripennis]